MATVIEERPPRERIIEVERTDASGWAIAIILLVVLVAGFVWWLRYHRPGALYPSPTSGGTNINVSVPPAASPQTQSPPPSAPQMSQ